jgi:peptidoglycan hydrolase CwlO-like protein
MKYLRKVLMLLAVLLLVNGVSGCKGKSSKEKAGEKIEKTQEEGPAATTGEKIDETMKKADEKIDETLEKVKESGKKINEGVEKTVEKIDEEKRSMKVWKKQWRRLMRR